MARFISLACMVLLLQLGIASMVSPVLAIDTADESTGADNENLAESPGSSPDILQIFLKNCADMISEPAVVGSGKECHDAFVKYVAEGPRFKVNYDYYLKRSEELYSICLTTVF
ncbi:BIFUNCTIONAL INHIBITOR/LIPID-TRANSFER PROTEIN/SEED STORAGE 2S ALBUMIN SUPERFAMILY PROTEIN-RELATED [Salix purpurea]|uniref:BIFUNCTIONAL INHIBITOR/LIPID-TRANSFER PROTEIN/SEED STORAGE 2S ALBUMIN SUPERFAMILY PROTEIN-RELATED n=1 Tax=Salix purpurea TaxID=77065 RepID=A0A9Q0Q4T2_SALPP|nr:BIFUNCTIONAL INHIBITOR/LIPID-TRANSFER PROTEIN/SEED STORAGE 2S ALBUMIN SUPERFAMILY PROTEIN-RELATED [Salix purpurea]